MDSNVWKVTKTTIKINCERLGVKYFQTAVATCMHVTIGRISLNIQYVILHVRLTSLGIRTSLEDENIPIQRQELAHVMFIERDACWSNILNNPPLVGGFGGWSHFACQRKGKAHLQNHGTRMKNRLAHFRKLMHSQKKVIGCFSKMPSNELCKYAQAIQCKLQGSRFLRSSVGTHYSKCMKTPATT